MSVLWKPEQGGVVGEIKIVSDKPIAPPPGRYKIYPKSDGFYVLDSSDTEKKLGGGGGGGDFVWTFSGTLSTIQNQLLPKLSPKDERQINQLVVLLQTAPTGQSAIFDFKVDGVSIGTVEVAAGDVVGSTVLDPAETAPADSVLTAEITQVGSLVRGVTATMIARVT